MAQLGSIFAPEHFAIFIFDIKFSLFSAQIGLGYGKKLYLCISLRIIIP